MEIKTTKTVEAIFTIDDLKEILIEKLGISKFKKEIEIRQTTETHVEPGGDPHDSWYSEIFTGIKLTYKE